MVTVMEVFLAAAIECMHLNAKRGGSGTLSLRRGLLFIDTLASLAPRGMGLLRLDGPSIKTLNCVCSVAP